MLEVKDLSTFNQHVWTTLFIQFIFSTSFPVACFHLHCTTKCDGELSYLSQWGCIQSCNVNSHVSRSMYMRNCKNIIKLLTKITLRNQKPNRQMKNTCSSIVFLINPTEALWPSSISVSSVALKDGCSSCLENHQPYSKNKWISQHECSVNMNIAYTCFRKI